MSTARRRYHIHHAVGKGAFGTVYRASMLGEGGFRKEVAIKLMNANLKNADEMAQRQRDEARVLGLVRHRAILQVDGLVRLNGTWAVVMEFIDGANLGEVLRSGSMVPRCALEVAAEVATALHIAYTTPAPDGRPLKLLHRDIKPSNIQLSSAGEVKLLDFGVARAEFETREAETIDVIMGTLRYMAPERLDGMDTPAGDIYALGVTLVEMLTCSSFRKTSASPHRHQATLQHAAEMLDRALGADAVHFRRLVLRCLAYEPEERPNAEELAKTLRALAERLPPPRLTEWAGARIDDIKSHRREILGSDELSGETLVEQSGSELLTGIPSDAQDASTSSRARMPLALVGLGLVLGLPLVGALGWWTLGASEVASESTSPAGTVTEASADLEPAQLSAEVDGEAAAAEEAAAEEATDGGVGDAVANEDGATDATGAEGVETAPAPKPAPSPRPVSAPAPRAAPVQAPVPAPVPVPAARGTVRVEGTADRVYLTGSDGKRYGPGEVPPGTYTLTAVFGGDEVQQSEPVTVVARGLVTITCDAMMVLCNLK